MHFAQHLEDHEVRWNVFVLISFLNATFGRPRIALECFCFCRPCRPPPPKHGTKALSKEAGRMKVRQENEALSKVVGTLILRAASEDCRRKETLTRWALMRREEKDARNEMRRGNRKGEPKGNRRNRTKEGRKMSREEKHARNEKRRGKRKGEPKGNRTKEGRKVETLKRKMHVLLLGGDGGDRESPRFKNCLSGAQAVPSSNQ